jgi:hypothetical protein
VATQTRRRIFSGVAERHADRDDATHRLGDQIGPIAAVPRDGDRLHEAVACGRESKLQAHRAIKR